MQHTYSEWDSLEFDHKLISFGILVSHVSFSPTVLVFLQVSVTELILNAVALGIILETELRKCLGISFPFEMIPLVQD